MYCVSYEDNFSKYTSGDNSGNIEIPATLIDICGNPYIPGHTDISAVASTEVLNENREKDHTNLGYAVFTKMLNFQRKN